ncbi:unnamed protein product, partial [marine sediment metagenome]
GVYSCTLTDAIEGTRTSPTLFTVAAGTWVADVLIGGYVFSYKDTNAADGTWTKINDNDTNTVTVDDTLFTGANRIKILTVKKIGVTVPTEPPTCAASGDDGSLGVGDYKFCYTYVDLDGYESNPSDVSEAETAAATNHITVTMVNSGSLRKRVYRTAVGGAIYYKNNIDTLVAADTATYDSTQADLTLGSIVKTDHTAPESTSHLITKRRNKLYLAFEDYLYPSYTSDIEYFPPLWRLRTGNSQKITGLTEQLTALPVMTDDSVERLVGTDEDNFEFKNSYSTEGCIAMRSLVNCDNFL